MNRITSIQHIKINNPQLFWAFIENILSVKSSRLFTEIIGFYGTFRNLLSSSDNKIDVFVTATHTSNSAWPLNGKILIPNKDSQALKSLLFDLKDRDLCGSLPDPPTLQGIYLAQASATRNTRFKSKQHQYRR